MLYSIPKTKVAAYEKTRTGHRFSVKEIGPVVLTEADRVDSVQISGRIVFKSGNGNFSIPAYEVKVLR